MPPGTYTFHVIAANSHGYWNEVGEQLQFTILPPWWQTWWFRVFVVVFIIGLVVFIVVIRTRNMREQNKLLEVKVSERTRELLTANNEIANQNITLSEKQKTIEHKNSELSHTLETKDRLMSIIAHDLKNPLGAVVGVLDLLQKNYIKYDDAKRMKFIDGAFVAATKLQEEMLNLLEWARSQTSNIAYKPDVANVNDIISDVVSLLAETARNKNISIKIELTKTIKAFIDARMISTVVRNLLGNSIKFTPDDGIITLSATENELQVQITISDTGVGMSEEQIQKLFNPDEFNSTYGTNNEKGTGLGLKICHEFIQKNQGYINVKSTIGKSTSFIITLPKPIEIEEVSSNKITLPQTQTFTENAIEISSNILLVIEDNSEMREFLSAVFSDYFTIVSASDGLEGKRKALELIPDIILSDINMPLQNGIEMCKEIKANAITSHIPVVLVTSEIAKESELIDCVPEL
ncbi:MAG: hybrid sensor histidine kinase/response regulator [Bacteroidales bacterium]|nr:hybrid sensor histidine kinase/response regulator [Bacteroidales bacterium]